VEIVDACDESFQLTQWHSILARERTRKQLFTRIPLISAIGLSPWLLHHYNRGGSLLFADNRFIGHRSHLDCLFQKAEEEFPT
jgi:hypothetical protein